MSQPRHHGIAETIESLQAQRLALHEILVVDGLLDRPHRRDSHQVRRAGPETPQNTDSKAGAQTFALKFVETEFCIAIDADTLVEPTALERLMPALDDPLVAARLCSTPVRWFDLGAWSLRRVLVRIFVLQAGPGILWPPEGTEMAGLPGTSLRGIFYALLIVWMAVREIWHILRGVQSQVRWRAIAKFNTILVVIVVVLGAEFWAVQYVAQNWILPSSGRIRAH